MIGLLQRVIRGQVASQEKVLGEIGCGLVVMVGVEAGDSEMQADRLLERLLGYRVFADENERMNRSLSDIGGGLLLIPQFTLAADTRKGMRPSFSPAANPKQGRHLFQYLCDRAGSTHEPVETGAFGADMQVSLVNDGPVTFWLQV